MGSAKSLGATKFAEGLQVDTPEAAMRIACARLLRTCGIDRPPVSLKKLLTHLDVCVDVVDRPLAADAELYLRKGQFTVVISGGKLRQNWARTRFTIAHEFGHILLAHHLANATLFASLDETPDAHRQNEYLCDIAAKELLMPSAMVKSAVYENGLNPHGLGAIRHAFGVSRAAMIKRVSETLPGAHLFTWRKHARHAREENTYRVVSSTRYHPSNANPWLPVGCTAEHVWPRVLQKAANTKAAIYEEEVEVILSRRNWRGQGAVTFFPFEDAIQQEFDERASIKDTSHGAPHTLYLLLAGRELSLAQYLRRRHAH